MVYLLEAGGKLITLALCPGGKGGLVGDFGGGIGVGGVPGCDLAGLPLEGHAVFGVAGGGSPRPGVGAQKEQHHESHHDSPYMGHGLFRG